MKKMIFVFVVAPLLALDNGKAEHTVISMPVEPPAYESTSPAMSYPEAYKVISHKLNSKNFGEITPLMGDYNYVTAINTLKSALQRHHKTAFYDAAHIALLSNPSSSEYAQLMSLFGEIVQEDAVVNSSGLTHNERIGLALLVAGDACSEETITQEGQSSISSRLRKIKTLHDFIVQKDDQYQSGVQKASCGVTTTACSLGCGFLMSAAPGGSCLPGLMIGAVTGAFSSVLCCNYPVLSYLFSIDSSATMRKAMTEILAKKPQFLTADLEQIRAVANDGSSPAKEEAAALLTDIYRYGFLDYQDHGVAGHYAKIAKKLN